MTRCPNAHANQEEDEEEINNTEEEREEQIKFHCLTETYTKQHIISNIHSIYFQNCYEISENIKKCEMLFSLLFS